MGRWVNWWMGEWVDGWMEWRVRLGGWDTDVDTQKAVWQVSYVTNLIHKHECSLETCLC